MIRLKSLLDGHQLTTVEILYHLPDHPQLLQAFIWQDYDVPPDFPKVMRFLEFWSKSIEGKLHSVKVATAGSFIVPSSRFACFYDQLN